MLKSYFANTIYLRILPNLLEIKHIESGNVVVEPGVKAFTTERLLVGDFDAASKTLKLGLKRLWQNLRKLSWLAIRPVWVVHPMHKVESGLSDVERRLFEELAIAAGARKVALWVGHELTDAEVLEQANRA